MIDAGVLQPTASLDDAYYVSDPAALNELQQMENRVAVAQLLTLLDSEQYEVIRLLFGDEPKTTREAARVLGTHHVAIQRTRDAALARMRKFAKL